MRAGGAAISNPWGLTPGECATLTAISMGDTAKVIARAQGISHRSLEKNMQQAMKKLNARNRMQAVIAWDRFTRQEVITTPKETA